MVAVDDAVARAAVVAAVRLSQHTPLVVSPTLPRLLGRARHAAAVELAVVVEVVVALALVRNDFNVGSMTSKEATVVFGVGRGEHLARQDEVMAQEIGSHGRHAA